MKQAFQGWRLVGITAAVIAAVLVVVAVTAGTDIPGLRLMIRITARTSLVLFGLAFTASALARLFPSPWTRWQMRNRRYLGVSFAASHAMHLAIVLAFYFSDPVLFVKSTNLPTFIGGVLGYVFVAAMTATSFDRSAAWLGARAWKILHTTGSYYLWIVFAVTFLPRSLANAFYWPFFAFTLALIIIRIAAAISRRAAPAAAG